MYFTRVSLCSMYDVLITCKLEKRLDTFSKCYSDFYVPEVKVLIPFLWK